MKNVITFVSLAFLLSACIEDNAFQPEDRTLTYLLHQAGYAPVKGKVDFTELPNGNVKVEINLENTADGFDFPAHLHFGGINEVGDLALRLNDVNGNTGKSVTILEGVTLNNGELVTLSLINQINGSVKIHLSSGLLSHVVLSYGNIGKNKNYISDGMAVCTGH